MHASQTFILFNPNTPNWRVRIDHLKDMNKVILEYTISKEEEHANIFSLHTKSRTEDGKHSSRLFWMHSTHNKMLSLTSMGLGSLSSALVKPLNFFHPPTPHEGNIRIHKHNSLFLTALRGVGLTDYKTEINCSYLKTRELVCYKACDCELLTPPIYSNPYIG